MTPSEELSRLRTLDSHRSSVARLTATPNLRSTGEGYSAPSPGAMTVWVEPDRLWLRPVYPTTNADAGHKDGWAQLTKAEWESLRGCVDRYFEGVEDRA